MKARRPGDGAAIVKYEYDIDGNRVRQRYFDETGKPMKNFSGVHEIANFFSTANMLTSVSYSSYETTTKYNEDGQPIEYATLDKDGNHFKSEDGYSVEKFIYNSDGGLEERQSLHNNKLVDRNRGVTSQYSIIKYGYDEKGRVIELTFWGSNQRPVNARVRMTDSITVHRIVFVYRGNKIIEQEFYKINESNPSQVVDCLESDYISVSGLGIGRRNAN